MKPLVWMPMPGNRWRIDWRRLRDQTGQQGIVAAASGDVQDMAGASKLSATVGRDLF